MYNEDEKDIIENADNKKLHRDVFLNNEENENSTEEI